MKTLEQVKKDKNWLACKKGYPMDPEGFPLWFLIQRLDDEYKEWETEIAGSWDDMINELADISNLCDYIATKLTTGYPDKYQPQQQGEK